MTLKTPARGVIFAVMSVGLLIASVDNTTVATALPTLQRSLHTTLN